MIFKSGVSLVNAIVLPLGISFACSLLFSFWMSLGIVLVFPQGTHCTICSVFPQGAHCTICSVFPQGAHCTICYVFSQGTCSFFSVCREDRLLRLIFNSFPNGHLFFCLYKGGQTPPLCHPLSAGHQNLALDWHLPLWLWNVSSFFSRHLEQLQQQQKMCKNHQMNKNFQTYTSSSWHCNTSKNSVFAEASYFVVRDW